MVTGSRFETLDSWRGISAIFIVIFHFIGMMPTSLESSTLVRNAYLFVDFFFVLSGFVLYHSYREKITCVRDIGPFAVRRFGRVWPLHAIILCIFVATIAVISRYPHPDNLDFTWNENTYAFSAILPSLFLLNAMKLHDMSWNGPAWSIGAEFYTYLLFALVLLVARRRLISTCTCVSVAALVFLFWYAPNLMNTTWDYGIVRCIAGFFAGVIAYCCYERLSRQGFLWSTVLECVAISIVMSFVTFAGNGPDKVSAASLAAPVIFGAAVVVFAGGRGLVSLILRMRPLRALGRYSYSIYMIHQPLLIMLCYGVWLSGYHTKIFGARGSRPWMGSIDLILVEFVLGVVLVAAATYRLIEVPARNRFNRIANNADRVPLVAVEPPEWQFMTGRGNGPGGTPPR